MANIAMSYIQELHVFNFRMQGCQASSIFILDCSNLQWHREQLRLKIGYRTTGVLIGDNWYVSAYFFGDPQIFSVYLPNLISSVISPSYEKSIIILNHYGMTHELTSPPFTRLALLALQNNLLVVGGYGYNLYQKEIHRYAR